MAQLDTSTRLAYERTYLAYERTLMGWVRTAISLISFFALLGILALFSAILRQ
jgi:uncharacterized membrane protein YidH (DUF202 family)